MASYLTDRLRKLGRGITNSTAYQEIKRVGKTLVYSPKHLGSTLGGISLLGTLSLSSLTACGNVNGPENQNPVAEASADPTQGYSPLPVNFDGRESHDPDGIIETYYWNFGDGVRDSTSGAVANYMYETAGSYTTGLTVVDNSGGRGSTTLEAISVTQPPQKSLSQTVGLSNFEDINYSATSTNVPEATRKTFYNGNLNNTQTIQLPHAETLTSRLDGNWTFILEAPNVKPDTTGIGVPDYESEAPDLSGVNLDVNERDSIIVHVPRATDKNTAHNPVHYTSVISPNGSVIPTIGTFPLDTVLKIVANGVPGPYQVELARQGSLEKIVLPGEILDVADPIWVRNIDFGSRQEGA